jgi:NitT/TauT family transport system permease protein
MKQLILMNKRIPAQAKSIVLFIGIWWILSLFMSPNILPSPLSTIKALSYNRIDVILFHIGKTMQRIILGFLFAMLIGLIFGILMGLSRKLENWLDMWVMIFLSIPGLVFVVLSFMWFGMNEFSTIVAISVTSFPIVALNVWQGVKDVDVKLVDMARVFGASPQIRLKRVILPQTYPYIMASARSCFGIAWKVTALVELLGRSNGVGYQLNYWFQLFNMEQVLAWVGLFLVIVLSIEMFILKPLEKKLFAWRPEIKL